MPIYYDERKRRWRFTFNKVVNGHRIRVTKLLPKAWNRNQAQAFDQSETAKLFGAATGTIKQRSLIGDAVVAYCQHRCPSLKEGEEIEKELARLHGYYDGRFIDELPEVAREYIEAECDRVTPATLRNKLSYLRAACRYAQKYHGMDNVPDIDLPRVRNERKEYLVRHEMIQVARSCKTQRNGAWRYARAMVRIAFYSGMRISEIMRIDNKDRLGRYTEIVEDGFILYDTKNGEDRFVPMHPKLKVLLKYLPIPYSVTWMQQIVRRAMDEAGFEHITFHDLRHSTASNLINDDSDLYKVGLLLGHKDPRSTQRYAHLAKKTMNEFIRKLG
ncbi:site-specific integrase [Oxalobacter vibrioformis]|uniref:Site-specific integrase n=1 Tax=Oxalobacter vibrioformis TaxID=933080 RepID=A0A9E9LVQ5_9BURK|nr:site-specific integrase [Oxalobacter vibrioformis]WAW10610.1 site-specific integrase [Oxalobacter vibrioformis]